METLNCIKKRKSVRSFSNKKIPREVIEKIIDAGKAAPSAGGLASQRFFIADKKEEKEKLARIAWDQDFIAEASHIIVIFADEEKVTRRYGSRGKFYAVCDGSAAVENILLAVTDLGLGSVWVGAFDDIALKRFFRTDFTPIAILPIGYEK